MAWNNVRRLLLIHGKYVNRTLTVYPYSNLKNSVFIRNNLNPKRYYISNGVDAIDDNTDTNLSEAISILDSHKKEQRIYKDDVISVIKNIQNEGVENIDNGILLLQSCGCLIPDELPEKRIALVEQIWETLRAKNVEFTTEHYNTLLRSYIENCVAVSHKDFLGKMSSEPNEQTYHLLLELTCENADIAQAAEIVNLMKNNGLPANEPVFSSLILGHLKAKDLKSCQNILDTMRITHVVLTTATYTALLRGYAEISNLLQFTNIMQNAKNLNFSLDQIISVINSICLSENENMLNLVKKNWASAIENRLFETKLVGLCIQLVHLKKPEIAYNAYKILIEPELTLCTESEEYASFLLYEMIKTKTNSDTVIKMTDDLVKTGRNTYALFKATHVALSIPDIEFSLALLKALFDRKHTLRNHYFWPILIHEGKLHGEHGLFKIFKIMQDFNLHIDFETLETYSLQYIDNIVPVLLLERLKQFNLTISEVLTPLCIVLLRAGRMKDAANLCEKYKISLDSGKFMKQLASAFIASNDINNTITFLKHIFETNKGKSYDWPGQFIFLVITRWGNKINYEQIKRLLQAYKKNNLTITSMYVERIEHLCNKIKDEQLKSEIGGSLEAVLNVYKNNDQINGIPHPRDMNLDELECHLIELKNKKMETRGVMRKLIQMHCRLGNINRVNELYNDFTEAKYNVSVGMNASLLDLYLKHEKFTDAWKVFNSIKQSSPSFIIDEFKIVDLARLLVKNDMFEDALKIIDFESSNRRMRGGKSIEHNCWKLLDTVANYGNVTHTHLMFDTLINKKYCSENNMLLGPLIRVYLNNDNYGGAVDKFVKCSSQYNKTPLLHELLCKLSVNEGPSELIQKVVDASVKLHGVPCTNMSLIAALAETGQVKHLRKLLMNLKTKLPQYLFEQYSEKWIKDNNAAVFHNILNSSKGITHIDLSVVYASLMRLYCINNDCNSALNLWNDIVDQCNIPPKKVKNMLANLLRSHNHPKISSVQS